MEWASSAGCVSAVRASSACGRVGAKERRKVKLAGVKYRWRVLHQQSQEKKDESGSE